MTKKCFSKTTCGMITCLAIFSSSSALAESEAFKSAVKIFKQGYSECTEAQRIRSQDINHATEKFSKYLEMKDEAAKMDPSILTTRLHNISREIEYCEKAHEDILRSKAFPIMETSLEACQQSKEQLAKANTVEATSSYKKYEELYQKATDITPSIAKVSSVQLKVARCNKLKKKIVEAEAQLTKIKAAYAADHKTISSALESCGSAKDLLAGENPSLKNISKAKALLKESNEKLADITNKRNDSSDHRKYASLHVNQQVSNKIASTKKCSASLAASISDAESLRKKNEAARLRLAKEKLEKDKVTADRLKIEQKRKDEAERLANEAKIAEAKRLAEEKRLANLKQNELQQLKEQEVLNQQRAEEEEKQRELAKERLRDKRKSLDWSSSLVGDDSPSAASDKNDGDSAPLKKEDDWRSLIR
jgi:hypothetical protein